MPRQKKYNPDQPGLFELSLKTALAVPAIRQTVRQWVTDGYPGATKTSQSLLKYWFTPDGHRLGRNGEKFQYHYFQKEAAETLVYLYEVAQIRRHKDLIESYVTIPPTSGGQGGYACCSMTTFPATALKWLPAAAKPKCWPWPWPGNTLTPC